MRKLLNLFVRDDSGVSAMEYAILAGVIVVALTAIGSSTFQTDFQTLFNGLFTKIEKTAN